MINFTLTLYLLPFGVGAPIWRQNPLILTFYYFNLTLIDNADNSNPMDLTELLNYVLIDRKSNDLKILIQIVYLFKQLIYQILLFLLFFLQPEKWLTILEWIKVQYTAYIRSGKVFKESWILTTA